MSSVDNRIVRMTFDNASFERKVASTLATLDRLKQKLNFDKSADSFRGISIAASKVDFSGCERGVESLNTKLSTLGVIGTTALVNLTNSAINAGKSLVSSVIKPLTTGGWTRAMNIEQAKFKLEGLGVTGNELGKVWDNVTDAVDGTAYSLDAAALVAAQLAASGMRGGELMAKSLRGVSGVASVTGSSYEDIGRIFTQVAGQGRLMGDQLLQLSGRGMNAAATLAEQMHVSEAEVRDMVSKGKIDFNTFAMAMNDAFGESAYKANESLTGVLANVKSALAKIGADFFTPFVTNTSTADHVSNLVELLNRVRESINMVRKSIEPFRKAIVDPILGVIQGVTGYIEKFNKLTSDTVKVTKQVTETVTKTVPNANKALEALAKTVIRGDWGNGAARMQALTKAGHDYAATQNVVNQIMWGTYDASKAVNQTITEQVTKTEEVEEKVRTFRDNIADGFANIVNVLVKPLEAIATAFGEVFKIEDSVFVINMISDAFYRLTSKLVPTDTVLSALKSTFKSVFTTIKSVATALIVPFQVCVKVGELLIGAFQRLLGVTLNLVSGFAKLLAFPFVEFNNIISRLFSNNDFLKSLSDICAAVKSIRESFNTLKKALLDAAISIASALGGPFKKITKWLKNLRENFESGTVKLITSGAQKIAKFITAMAKAISDWVSKTTPGIEKWSKSTSESIKKWVDGPIEKISEIVGKVKSVIIDWTKSATTSISGWFSGTYGKISEWVSSCSNWFHSWSSGPISKVSSLFITIKESVVDWTQSTSSFIQSWISGPASTVPEVFSSIKDGVADWAKSTMPKVAEWVSKTGTNIKKWCTDTKDKFKEWTKDVAPVVKDWCKDSAENISKWYEETAPKIKEWCEEVWRTLKEWYDRAAPVVTDWVEKTTQEISIWAANIGPTIQSWASTFNTNLTKWSDIAFDVVSNFFSDLKKLASGDTDILGGFVKSLGKSIANVANFSINFKFKPGELFKSIFGDAGRAITDGTNELTNKANSALTASSTTLGKTIKKSFFSTVSEIISQKTTEAVDVLTGAFGNFTSTITNGIDDMPLEKIKSMFDILIMGGLGLQSIRTFNQLGNMFESFGGVGKSLSKFVDSWKRVSPPKPTKMNAFYTFAKSVGIIAITLSTSIALLTNLDTKKAWTAVQQLLVFVGGIGAVVIAISRFSKNLDSVNAASNALIKMAGGLALLTIPIAILGSMDTNKLIQGLGATITMIIALTASISIMGKFVKNLKGAAATLLGISAALTLLTVPIMIFASIDTNFLIDGMLKTGLALAGLTAALSIIGSCANDGSLKGAASALLALSASLTLLIVPIAIFGAMDFNKLSQGLITVGIALFAFTAVLTALNGLKLDGVAKSILSISAALTLLVIPITILGALPWEVLVKGGSLTAVMLIALTGAMVALSNFAGSASASAVALLAIAAGLSALVIPIVLLGQLPMDVIVQGMVALGAALLALIGAGYLAAPVAPALVAIGIGALGLGGAATLCAAAVWLIADAISKTADLAPGAGQKLVNFLAEFAQTLAVKGFEIGVNLMSGLVQGIIGGAVGVFKGLLDMGGKMISGFCSLLGIHSPSTVFENIGGNLDQGLINGITGNSEPVNEAMSTLGNDMMESLGIPLDGSYDLGSASIDELMQGCLSGNPEFQEMMKQFGMDAMTNQAQGVTENSELTRQAFNDAQAKASQGTLDGIFQNSSLINTASTDAGKQQLQSYVSGLSSTDINVQQIGADTSNQLLTGLKSNEEAIKLAGSSAMGSFATGFKESSSNLKTECETILKDICTTINNKTKDLKTAGGNLISGFKTGMQMKMTEVSNAITQMVNAIVTNINNKAGSVRTAGANIIKAAKDGMSSNYSGVLSSINQLLTNVVSAINAKTGQFSSAGTKCGSALKSGFAAGMNGLTFGVSSAVAQALKTANSYVSGFRATGSNCGYALSHGLSSGLYDAQRSVTGMMSAAVRAAGSYQSGFYYTGQNCGFGMVNGLSSVYWDVYWAGYELGYAALMAAKRAVRSNSPSKEFITLGENNGEGYVIGMNSMTKDITKSASKMGFAALTAFSTAMETAKEISESDGPVITPIIDLSEVRTGAEVISSLLGNMGSSASYSLAYSGQSTFRRDRGIGESALDKAIRDLKATMVGESNTEITNTFNISGSDPKAIADEVSRRIQFSLERGKAAWGR